MLSHQNKGGGFSFVVGLISLVLSGCAVKPFIVTPAEKLPNDQVAIIKCWKVCNTPSSTCEVDRLWILKVDETKTVPYSELLLRTGQFPPFGNAPSEAHVTPGKHSFYLWFSDGYTSGQASLWLVAQPGLKYAILAEHDVFHVRFWIQEWDSEKIVGGICGSMDEPKN